MYGTVLRVARAIPAESLMGSQPLRRLLDLDGVADLERRAALDPSLASPMSGFTDPQTVGLRKALFGIELSLPVEDEWDADDDNGIGYDDEVEVEGDADADELDQDDEDDSVRLEVLEGQLAALLHGSDREVAARFRERGWDVTDQMGRPLLVLEHFKTVLALVVIGALPPPTGSAEAWGSKLEQDARSFKRVK